MYLPKIPIYADGKKMLYHKESQALPHILIMKDQKIQTSFTVVSRQTPCSFQSVRSKALAMM